MRPAHEHKAEVWPLGWLGALRYQARCESCAWKGPRRSLREEAEADGRWHEEEARRLAGGVRA